MPSPTAAPAALKLVKGRRPGYDSGGRKVNPTPGFRRLAPERPDWMAPEAVEVWDKVVPELMRLQLLKENDGPALVAYCEAWAQFVEATRVIQREGLTIEAKQGTLAHPAVAIQRNAGREMRAWAAHFGLTPSAEQNLAAGKGSDAEENPFGPT